MVQLFCAAGSCEEDKDKPEGVLNKQQRCTASVLVLFWPDGVRNTLGVSCLGGFMSPGLRHFSPLALAHKCDIDAP